ncbi:MAG: VTT domain-containing protein [Aigarchaeota archaeon]|nr:VTT domain-containing protein [Aigarchaeota archaeon]MDW8093085.1 VTT domain-containing protein [Nitrososphaerota archaeon]
MDVVLFEDLLAYGYFGVFLASLVGSLLPFVSGPYLVPITFAVIAGRLDPLPVSLLSALGAAVGKSILFVVYKRGRKFLKDDTRRRVLPLERLLSRYGWIAVLGAAATPLPDDVVYLPLALANYSSIYFLPVVFAGKLVITTSASFLVFYSSDLACLLVDCGAIYSSTTLTLLTATAVAALSLSLAYLLTRLNWEVLLKRFGLIRDGYP